MHSLDDNLRREVGLARPHSLPLRAAGLDFLELYKPQSENQLREFWSAFQDLFLTLYPSRLATIAAVEGHAPAAGCLLALACDYRVGARGPYAMGFNEVQFGLRVPPWFVPVIQSTVGTRQTGMPAISGSERRRLVFRESRAPYCATSAQFYVVL